jgi:putative Mg2+ transporter-C (MgtC) family protein
VNWTEITVKIPDISQLLIDIGIGTPDWRAVGLIIIQLLAALIVGSLLGINRERREKAAGLRTHMLVALGACIYTIAISAIPDCRPNDMAQVVKGIAAGIGFLGAGCILKSGDHVSGVTTAATIWVAAALGLAIGAGYFALGILGALTTWSVLICSNHHTE